MNRRWRGWVPYALAWVPVLIGYSNFLMRTRSYPLDSALESALVYIGSAALLGALVLRAASRVPPPNRKVALSVMLQAAMASVFSLAWLAAIVLHLLARVGMAATMHLVAGFDGRQFLIGLWVYGIIAGVSSALRATGRSREREASAARAEALRMHAELEALRGQLNPHTLFTTLHTVSGLVQRDPVTARQALERFAELLRYVLDARRLANEDVTLAEELGFVRDYLALEQLRLGDRLSVVEQIDFEALDCVIPSLMLQPIVENAIRHAISPRASGGTITIGASLEDDQLILVIADDGPGAVEEGVRAAQGLGLRVGRQRLEAKYPRVGHFTVTTAPGAGFTVTLTLPANFSIGSSSFPALPVG